MTEAGDAGIASPDYSFTLYGTPRIYGTPVSFQPVPPLLVLCTDNDHSGCIYDPTPASKYGTDTCQDVSCPNPIPAEMNIAGGLRNTTPNSAGSAIALDMNDTSNIYVLQGDGSPAAGAVVNSTGCPPGVAWSCATTQPSVAAVEGSAVGYVANGVFHSLPIFTPGACYTDSASKSKAVCQAITVPVVDPYGPQGSNLNPTPDETGLTTFTGLFTGATPACSAAGATTTCKPGVYTFPLLVTTPPYPAWAASTTYAPSTIIMPTGRNSAGQSNNHVYEYEGAANAKSGTGEPRWTDNGSTVLDGAVSWTDLGPTTTNLLHGLYVLDDGMQIGTIVNNGGGPAMALTSDPNGILLDFNGDGQLGSSVAYGNGSPGVGHDPGCDVNCGIQLAAKGVRRPDHVQPDHQHHVHDRRREPLRLLGVLGLCSRLARMLRWISARLLG